MKVRAGFVSNSSSSSFVLKKKNLTETQKYMIKHHIDWGKFIDMIDREKAKADGEYREKYWYSGFDCSEWDTWLLKETDDEITGEVSMDNFAMEDFFRLLGIDEKDYTFDHGHW